MNAAEQAQMTEWKKRAAEYRTNWVSEESKRILLEQERDAAMAVLAPSMPSSGLVDAAKQVKQVAITEKDNAETLEAENARLREESAAWKPVIDAAVAFEGARRAPEEVRNEKGAELHGATDGYLKWLIARCLRSTSGKRERTER